MDEKEAEARPLMGTIFLVYLGPCKLVYGIFACVQLVEFSLSLVGFQKVH